MEGGDIRGNPIVSQFLTNGESMEKLETMQEKYKLPVDRADEYLMLCRAVLDGDIQLDHMPEMIAEAFGVDEEMAKKIAMDVVAIRLLPLEGYWPGVEAQIVKWGGKVSDYSAFRVGKEKITADRFAGNLTENLELTLSPVHIKRLGFLVKSYFAGEKTRDATMTFFARPVNIGGLGLALEQAKGLMESIDESKEMVELVDDERDETFREESEEPVEPVNEVTESDNILKEARPVEEMKIETLIGGDTMPRQEEPVVEPIIEDVKRGTVTPPITKIKEEVVAEKIPEEIPVIANLPEVAPSMVVSTTTPVTPRVMVAGGELASDSEEIAAQAKVIAKKDIASEGNDEKLKAAVDLVLTSASTLLQAKRLAKKEFAPVCEMMIRGVRDVMQTRGVLVKEFGLDEASIDALLGFVDDGAKFYHQAEIKRGTVTPPIEVKAAVPTVGEVMDRRFAEVTKTLPKAPIVPVMDEARVSAARSKEDEVAEQAAKIDVAKLEVAAEAAKPVLAKAMLTVGSVAPSLPGEPVMMNDVKFKPRLVGPVDELGTMMPADFRRLSSDPVEATKKIEDLLAALQTTSFEERIRGIQAWRVSPVCRLYAAMAGEALQAGVALAEVASKRRNKGEESLSPAEMKAIGSLNAKMRF